MKEDIVLIDLFSGIGGFANGLEKAGFNITHHYFSEIDKKSISVYKYHFKKSEYVGSVIDVSGTEIRKKHPGARIIICFGWPCQDNSIAGKRKGHTSGTRSSLLIEAVRIIQEVQPDYFIAENVKGLYSVNEGADFIEAIRLLSYLNSDSPQYEVEQQLLNTKWIIPQNRERTYFVGYPRNRGCRQILPIREADLSDLQEEARRNIRERIQSREDAIPRRSGETSEDIDGNVRESEHALYQRGRGKNEGGVKEVCPTISSSAFENNNFVFTNPKGQQVNQEAAGTLTGGGNSGGNHSDMTKVISEMKEVNPINSCAISATYFKGKYGKGRGSLVSDQVEEFISNEMPCANSVTPDAYLTTGKRKRDENGKSVLTSMHERRIRRLTEIECELLQGFPSGWTEFGIDENGQTINISATQRYKQCGNAVSVPVVTAVGNKILMDIKTSN